MLSLLLLRSVVFPSWFFSLQSMQGALFLFLLYTYSTSVLPPFDFEFSWDSFPFRQFHGVVSIGEPDLSNEGEYYVVMDSVRFFFNDMFFVNVPVVFDFWLHPLSILFVSNPTFEVETPVEGSDWRSYMLQLRRLSRYLVFERFVRAVARLVDFVGSMVLLAVGPQYLLTSSRFNQFVKRVAVNLCTRRFVTVSYRHFLIVRLVGVSIGLFLTMPAFGYFNHVFSNPYFWWVSLTSLLLAFNCLRDEAVSFGTRTALRGIRSR